MGLPVRFASASASGPHGHQSTGLCLCCSRYGLVSFASRFSGPVGGVVDDPCAAMRKSKGDQRAAPRRIPLTIEGELVAKSTASSPFTPGDRVFHQKFGNGNVTQIDGNKLTIQFDRAGEKRVVDSFVERV